MLEILSSWLVAPSALTPHGFCLLWEPWLIWSYVLGDTATGLAYFVIPLALVSFVRRRRDLVFKPVFWLFAAFILLCGITHWLDLLTIWVPAYHIEAVLKLATAVVSVATTVTLWRWMPQALALPSPAQMQASNEALTASEAKLRTYFSDLADGIVVLHAEPDGSRFTYGELNKAAERLLCTTSDALRGKRPDEVWPETHARAIEAHLRECAASGRPLSYAEVVTTAEGERRELFVVLTPVHDAAGQVRELIKSLRDVTEHARLEARVRESEVGFRLLTEHASDMVSRVGPDGTRSYVSPAAARLFGTSPEALLGRGMLERVMPEDRDAIEASTRRLLAGTVEEESVAFRVVHPERGEVWVEAIARTLRDPATGAPDGYVAVTRDLTERRRAETERKAHEREAHERELERSNAALERLTRHLVQARDEAERASRAKSRFLAAVSHELRTPLNGILGYAELLRLEGGLSAKQSGRVDAMLGAGTHLLEMINRVLDLSEVEAERAELRVAEIDPREVATACLDLLRPAAQAKGLALSMAIAPDAPRHVTTDPTRLRQVLVNMLGNAVKFTAHGAVELRVRAATADTAALRIEVADTGPGIPAERRGQLFQDFERLDAEATNGAVEGAGLGLALSARLATLLGGRLGHEDNAAEGSGSVFWLELPLLASAATGTATAEAVADAAPAPDPDVPSMPPAAPALARAPLRVLVVDDLAMNRDIAASFLRTDGHEVVCAQGGVEAVEAVAASDFDVVLMDVRMPEVDGLEATRRIRALTGSRGRVPIVALTAQAFAEQVEECRRAGMDDHLAKPFTPDALLLATARAAARIVARPALPALGSELAILDMFVFERTAAFLAPKAVTSYLQTIAGRSEALLRALQQSDASAQAGGGLIEAVHALAGSAGMFGFERLAALARRFELTLQTSAPDAQALAGALTDAIKASLEQMPGRLRAAA